MGHVPLGHGPLVGCIHVCMMYSYLKVVLVSKF